MHLPTTTLAIAAVAVITSGAWAQQPILFDFDTAPIHSSLPISLTAGGMTAQLSATGQGFSIQPASTLGFTPVGFSGLCIYPNSIYAADLHIDFSQSLTAFSILYSTQELACDSSARMRVTAYLNGALVGTSTTSAQCADGCTWPTQSLAFSSGALFDSVVVHYDAPPPACQDYGVIFMADNMFATPVPPPPCPADFNGDHTLNVTDIFAFLSAWFAHDPRADFDGVGGIQVSDIFAFLTAWFAGCP